MKEFISKYYIDHPLRTIIFTALIVQLLASIFSEGYGMHDDHFLIIESASSWADGYDYNDWLPWNQKEKLAVAKGHSLTYPGVIYLIFEGLQFLNIDNPKFQMFIIRIFQSMLWLIAILYAFKISQKISNLATAKKVSWLLTIGALIPFLSVRNLVEMTCIPFLLIGIWHIVLDKKYWHFIIAGISLGMAFTIRYQIVVFLFVFGIVMLFQYKFKKSLLMLLGFLITVVLTQGLVDYLIWGKPFAEFISYFHYNISDHKYDYVKDLGETNWFNYILIIANLSVPLIGFFYWFGLLRNWKKLALFVLPLIAFVAFHSYYPNRQERFIFPMIPVFLIAGISGWELYRSKSNYWSSRPNLWLKISRPFFILSFLIGITSIFISAKQSRIDAMYFLYEKENVSYILKEHPSGDSPMNPSHYAGQWEIPNSTVKTSKIKTMVQNNSDFKPTYIYSYGDTDFPNRLSEIKLTYPEAKVIETFQPSWYDRLLHWLNPKGNKNEVIRVIEL
jgi:hypothetical protein